MAIVFICHLLQTMEEIIEAFKGETSKELKEKYLFFNLRFRSYCVFQILYTFSSMKNIIIRVLEEVFLCILKHYWHLYTMKNLNVY